MPVKRILMLVGDFVADYEARTSQSRRSATDRIAASSRLDED